MPTILLAPYAYQTCQFAQQALLNSRRTNFKLEVFRSGAWVQVTHETKEAVMSRITKEDLKAVGCNNPDIFVNGRRDDRIVLVPPRSLRNENKKYKKHVTSIRASEIFGTKWPEHLNVAKLQTLGEVYEDVENDYPDLRGLLQGKHTLIIIVRVSQSTLLAYISQ